jgi:hypothetical protein
MPRAPRRGHLLGAFLASLAVTLLSASVGRSSPTPPERLIDASGFGGLHVLGMPPDVLQKKLPRGWRVKLCAALDDGEGSYGFYPELCLSRARPKASFQVKLSHGGGQWTRSSYFRTADGLGVGDTLKAWVAKRKQLRCTRADGRVWTTFGEGTGYIHCPKGGGDTFPRDGSCMPYVNHDCHVASIHLLAPDAKPQRTLKAPPWHETPRWRKRFTALLKRACASSKRCKSDGLCAPDSGNQCVPATTTQCRRHSACRESGICTYRDGRCALATTGDCRRSDLCKSEKKCFFKGAECVTREATLTAEQAHSDR